MKLTLLTASMLLLTSTVALADSLTVKGMSCNACEKQVTSVVCKDKEMSQWFETCTAKVTDAKAETGEIRYTLKKGMTLDATKMSKIQTAVADTGRSIEPTPTK